MRTVTLPNFTREDELKCKCGCGMDVQPALLIALQAFIFFLSRVFQCPVRLIPSSGARCQSRNDATEGHAQFSYHLKALAVDGVFQMQTKEGSWRQIDNSDVGALANKSGLFTGIGYMRYKAEGKNLVHLDIRPVAVPVRW